MLYTESHRSGLGPRCCSNSIHPAWLLAALWLGLVFFVTPNFRWSVDSRESPFAGDFLQEWVGARVVATGQADRLYDLPWIQQYQHDPQQIGFEWSKDQYLPMVYPPFYYLLLAPLASLPYFWAAWLWAAFMAAGWWSAAVALGRAAASKAGVFRGGAIAGTRSQGNWVAVVPWLFVLGLLFPPLLESLISGQKGTLCLALLTGTFLLLNSRRPMAAGMLFGLMAFKPQLALCIGLAMLCTCQWRFIAGAAATVFTLLLVGLSLGVGVWGDYIQWAVQSGSYADTPGYSLAKSHSLHTLFLPYADEPWAWLQRTASGLLMVLTIFWLRQLLRGGMAWGEERGAVQFSGLVFATVLLSPHFYTYDLTILLLPAALFSIPGINAQQPQAGRWNCVIPAAVFIVGAVGTPLAAVTGLQWTSIALVLGLGYLAQQSSRAEASKNLAEDNRRSVKPINAPRPAVAGA